MKNTPLVSIIIPCYNCEKYVAETLNSVFEQDYPNIEVIVVNDGSTDNSESIVTNYSNINKRFGIKLINKPNGGLPAARNSGAEIAIGKYFVFLDSDDKIHQKYISNCVAVMEADDKINIVYSYFCFFDAQEGRVNAPDFSVENILKDNCIFPSAMMRKNVFEKVGKYDESMNYGEDWEFWIRVAKNFGRIYKIPETLFYYRKRQDKSSMVDNATSEIIEKMKWYIYQKHYEFYKKNKLGISNLIINIYELDSTKHELDSAKNQLTYLQHQLNSMKFEAEKYKKKYYSK